MNIKAKTINQLKNELEAAENNFKNIEKSEERFRSLVETTSDWIWEVDENAVYTYVSPKIRNMLGYEPEEVVGKTPFDLMPTEEVKRVAEIFNSIAASKKPIKELENANLHKNGHLVLLEKSGIPFFDAEGTLCGYRGIDRDITDRKKAEKELENLFNLSPDMICLCTPEGKFIKVNPSCERVLGYTTDEILKLGWARLVHPDDVEKTNKERVKTSFQPISQSLSTTCGSGKEKHS